MPRCCSKENLMGSGLVSVVIPAYKQAQYVGDAIRSVQKQTWPDFEAIVVNDASPDNTSEIVRSFTDPRVKLIIHGENRGLSAARNTGILASSGKILALLDADDMFHPEKLQMHVGFLENHSNIGVTYNARFELNHSDTTIRGIWRGRRSTLLSWILSEAFRFRQAIWSCAGNG